MAVAREFRSLIRKVHVNQGGRFSSDIEIDPITNAAAIRLNDLIDQVANKGITSEEVIKSIDQMAAEINKAPEAAKLKLIQSAIVVLSK